MKKLYKLLYVLIIPAALVFYSYSSGSPGGKTGSPGDGGSTCTECHSSSVQQQSGWITTDIPAEGYTPGETYTITATGTHSGVVRFGFELTAENDADTKIGTFTITDTQRTKMSPSNTSVTHTFNGVTPSGDSNSWSMDWTAPEEATGTVTFYASFNAANGNGNTSGDQIYTSSLTVNEYVPAPEITSVDPDHAEQGWSGSVTILGENTDWEGGVFAVTFKYHDDNQISFSASSIDVKSNTELIADISVPEDQTIGEYDVYVDNVVMENGFVVDVASGIGDDHLAASLSIYPNPARNYLKIDLPETSQIRVVDITGKVMLNISETGVSETLDISSFKNGIYFIQIISDGNTATKRFLKN